MQYKEDGNHNFKMSKYRWAIDNYTVAIQCKAADELLNAICYTNRAAAHFRLGKCCGVHSNSQIQSHTKLIKK